jgi:bifunctional non-homologous end joining protein LigD
VKPATGAIQYSHEVEATGAAFFKAVDAAGLEGMVSKDRDDKYWSGRSKGWLKTKCFAEGEFDVIGVLAEPGEAPLALMASRDERKYVGGAFIALNQAMRDRLWKRVKTKAGPPPKGINIDKPKAQWVRPGLIGRVRFLKGEDTLRHATLHEVREE